MDLEQSHNSSLTGSQQSQNNNGNALITNVVLDKVLHVPSRSALSSALVQCDRATETSEVESLRPPRFFNEDGVIRPYRLRDGTGNQMLQVMENGRFAKHRYFTHVMINKTDMFMITRSGVLFVTKGTFGQLTCEWQYSFDEFTKEPFIVHGRRLRIEAKERVKSVFHAREFGKIINFKTPEDARWILTKLEEAREPSPSL